MCSARVDESPPSEPDDRTALARIRDAAIGEFGTHGFGVSVRAIAEAAGVSPGLIIHHFGSKNGLRAACDEQVLRTVRQAKTEAISDKAPGAFLASYAQIEEYAPLVAYILQSLQAGGDLAHNFVDHMIQDAYEYIAEGEANGIIKPSRDPHGRARYLVLQSLGAMTIQVALSEPGDDLATNLREYSDEVTLPALEFMTQGLLTDSRLLDEFLEYTEGSTTDA